MKIQLFKYFIFSIYIIALICLNQLYFYFKIYGKIIINIIYLKKLIILINKVIKIRKYFTKNVLYFINRIYTHLTLYL